MSKIKCDPFLNGVCIYTTVSMFVIDPTILPYFKFTINTFIKAFNDALYYRNNWRMSSNNTSIDMYHINYGNIMRFYFINKNQEYNNIWLYGRVKILNDIHEYVCCSYNYSKANVVTIFAAPFNTYCNIDDDCFNIPDYMNVLDFVVKTNTLLVYADHDIIKNFVYEKKTVIDYTKQLLKN